MNERAVIVFATFGLSLIGLFVLSPWSEKQFEDFVSLDKEVLDLGEIVRFKKGEGAFSITNRTVTPIRYRLSADCLCTRLNPREGMLQPRSSQTVVVSYSPKSISDRDFSRKQESADVVLNIVAGDVSLSKFLGVRATVLIPLTVAPHLLHISSDAMRESFFDIAFSVAQDVESVRLVRGPSFSVDSKLGPIDPELRVVNLRGSYDLAPGAYQDSFELQFTLNPSQQKRDQTFNLNLPVTVEIRPAYTFSMPLLAMVAGDRLEFTVMPREGISSVEVTCVSTQSENIELDRTAENSVRVVCLEKSTGLLPVAGHVETELRCTNTDGRVEFFKDYLPFVISERSSEESHERVE